MTLMREALLYASLNGLIVVGSLLVSESISKAIGMGCILLILAAIWIATGYAHTTRHAQLSRIRNTYSGQVRDDATMRMFQKGNVDGK